MAEAKICEEGIELEDGMVDGVSIEIQKYFDNLDWNAKDNEPNPTNAFITNLENINSRPGGSDGLKLKSQKLMNNELSLFNANPKRLQGVKLPPNKTNIRAIRHYYVAGVQGKAPPECPDDSQLTKIEQKRLFAFMTRNIFGQKIYAHEQNEFKELMRKAAAEERDYQSFVKLLWTKSHAQRCLHMLPSVQEFMVNLWTIKRQKCLDFYPTKYKPLIQGVRLASLDNENFSVLEFQKKVWRMVSLCSCLTKYAGCLLV